MEVKTSEVKIPDVVVKALDKRTLTLNYSRARCVYYCIWLWGETLCGVFGDGDWASYEWFVWDGSKLETSDSGYGSTSVALRDVLMKMEPVDAKPTQCEKHGGVNQYCSICLSDVAEKVAIGARRS